MATTVLQAEFRRLARLAAGIDEAEQALIELAVAFPVYRSYLPQGLDHLRAAVDTTIEAGGPSRLGTRSADPRLSDAADELCTRFQQATTSVMAKGAEDTAFYRYACFIGLNEVGGDPGQFGLSVADFHEAQQRRMQKAPLGMTTLSTHDTKRGEDLRARLAGLAEMPEAWADTAQALLRLAPIPNCAFGYLLWQTFAATGLIERERVHAFAEKAMREAAQETSWAEPNDEFERACSRGRRRGVRPTRSSEVDRIDFPTPRPLRVVQLPAPEGGPTDDAGGTGCVPGERELRRLSRGPR